jgi:hypothetical protein
MHDARHGIRYAEEPLLTILSASLPFLQEIIDQWHFSRGGFYRT